MRIKNDPKNLPASGSSPEVREALRIGFTMQLHKGFKEEYKRRHNNLWPELKELLKSTGISDYSIFFG